MRTTKAAPTAPRLATIALQVVGIKKLIELVQQRTQAKRQPVRQRRISPVLPGLAAAGGLLYLVKSGRASSMMDQVKRRFSSSSNTAAEDLPPGPETPPMG